MEISDLMMKEQLKNVYFVSSGKFGVSVEKYARRIADKHNLIFFNQSDFWFDCLEDGLGDGFKVDLDTGKFESSRRNMLIADHSDEVALFELIRISRDKKVIANVDFEDDLLSRVSENPRVALICPTAAKRLMTIHEDFEKILSIDPIACDPVEREKALKSSERKLGRMTETVNSFMKSGLQCVTYDVSHTESEIIEQIERCFGL